MMRILWWKFLKSINDSVLLSLQPMVLSSEDHSRRANLLCTCVTLRVRPHVLNPVQLLELR